MENMSTDLNKMKINRQPSSRFIELDVLRGILIALMIFFHLLWDLDYFGIVSLNHQIYQFQEAVPPVFFLLVGICLVVGKNKNLSKTPQEQKKYDRHLILRGLKIFGFGMALTIVTVIFMPDRPIIFGVLHFIGLSIILSIPFIRLKYCNILFASLIILAGIIIGQYPIENPTVFHLVIGLHQANIWSYTIDYFPLIPWFGATLVGIVVGSILYKDNKRRFYLPDLSKYKSFTTLSWVGKHSLAIYLLHQPVIAGVLFIFVLI
jgi:uncharacterized membrane protein